MESFVQTSSTQFIVMNSESNKLKKSMCSRPIESNTIRMSGPHSVAARSRAWVSGPSLAEIMGSSPVGDIDVCLSVVSIMCCPTEVSASC
jgi:hypothetical protein